MQSTKRNADRGLRGSDESQDSGYPSTSSTSRISIEPWLAERDPFRAVGIGHSRPFPLMRYPVTRQFADFYEAHVERQVHPILAKHHINIAGISMSRRGASNRPFTEIDYPHTLSIRTLDEHSATWMSAAQEIQEACRHAGIPNDKIEIEIHNPAKMKYMVSDVFSVDPAFLEDVESAKQSIVKDVTALCGLEWSSIAFHLRSPKFDSTAAKVPTVLVSFFDGVTLDFISIEAQLLEAFHHYKAGLRLELLRGSAEGAINQGEGASILTDLSRKPKNGSSIGVGRNTTEAGSLGGWLRLNLPNRPPMKFGITCHHVMAPGLDQNLTTIEYPATFDRIASMNFFESNLKSDNPMKGIDGELEEMRHHHAYPVIGNVFAFSGLRKNASNRRMDWAFFDTPETHTRNKPPPKSAFASNVQFPERLSFAYTLTEDSYVRNIGAMKQDFWVAKTGRISGVTSGIVNSMKRFVHWKQHGTFCSEEIEVIGLGKDFAKGGDSESIVTNKSGELVGLLIGKDSSSTEWGVGYVTPIHDIQQDVMQRTGGFLSLD